MELKEQILKYRAKHNLSQIEFAKRVEISAATISKIDNGKAVTPFIEERLRLFLEKDKGSQ